MGKAAPFSFGATFPIFRRSRLGAMRSGDLPLAFEEALWPCDPPETHDMPRPLLVAQAKGSPAWVLWPDLHAVTFRNEGKKKHTYCGIRYSEIMQGIEVLLTRLSHSTSGDRQHKTTKTVKGGLHQQAAFTQKAI